jgi:lysophospholipase L1-like esterase
MTNPAASTVLCFGDSNTHGAPSDDEGYVRLAADVRWTGRLQRLLGDAYDVIEAGLSGRTTDLEYDDRPGCNGRPYFRPCLLSHGPIDVVVLMLGTNDLKVQFDRSAAAIAEALGGYVDDIGSEVANRVGGMPSTVLLSPIHVDDSQPWFAELTADSFDGASVAKSRRLAAEISRVAESRGVLFADAATVARAGRDGLHLSIDSHAPLAALVAATIAASTGHPPRSYD